MNSQDIRNAELKATEGEEPRPELTPVAFELPVDLPNQVEEGTKQQAKGEATARKLAGLEKRRELKRIGEEQTAHIAAEHPDMQLIARTKVAWKPVDYCTRIAGLFINPITKELDRDVLSLNTDAMVDHINAKLGKEYATNRTFWTKLRPLEVARKSTKPCVEKIIFRLNQLGHYIPMPEPEGNKMSLNSVRPYLLGQGRAQSWVVPMAVAAHLGPKNVTIGRKVFHWVDIMGRKAEASNAAMLRSTSGDAISIDTLGLFLGMTREEVLSKIPVA
jgi:hypothetical protein